MLSRHRTCAARSEREREAAARRTYDVLAYQDPHLLTAAETRRELGYADHLPAQEYNWTARAMSRPQTRLLSSGIRHNLHVYKGILSKMMDDGYFASASLSMNLKLNDLRRQLDSFMCIQDFISVIKQMQCSHDCQEPPMLALPIVVDQSMDELERLNDQVFQDLCMSHV